MTRTSPNPESVITARTWRIHWLSIEPTTKRYQEPVSLARVLAEHHAAVAAVPVIEGEVDYSKLRTPNLAERRGPNYPCSLSPGRTRK